MASKKLPMDPINLVITGVGGQGNVLASRLLGEVMTDLGWWVTIGETFGASQRGGSVMSHLRVSSKGVVSPQIPLHGAHGVVALEPIEALRVLKDYGNPGVMVLCNTRPVHSIGVISGEQHYPSLEEIKAWIVELSREAHFIEATDKAVQLGQPILANVVAVGALQATGLLPFSREEFERVLRRRMPAERVGLNLKAFDAGRDMVTLSLSGSEHSGSRP